MTIWTLQPADIPDNIRDGQVYTRRPYPFFVDERGAVQRQDFWRGRVATIIGFVADPMRMEVDLDWTDYVTQDPTSAVGMYVITADRQGAMSTQVAAIAEVKVND